MARLLSGNKILPYQEQRPGFQYILPSQRAAQKPASSSASDNGTLTEGGQQQQTIPPQQKAGDEGALGAALVGESELEKQDREKHHHHPEKEGDLEKGASAAEPASPAAPAEIDDTVVRRAAFRLRSRFQVTWYGDDDPEKCVRALDRSDVGSPQNWSNSKKLFMTGLLGLYTASVYICSAIYTPGIGSVETDFDADQTEATLGLTLFVFGCASSPEDSA